MQELEDMSTGFYRYFTQLASNIAPVTLLARYTLHLDSALALQALTLLFLEAFAVCFLFGMLDDTILTVNRKLNTEVLSLNWI